MQPPYILFANLVVQELDTGKFLVKKSRDTEIGHEFNLEEFLYMSDYYHREYAKGNIWRNATNVCVVDSNAQRHCSFGPATIDRDGTQEWWWHGERIPCKTQEEFERRLKMIAYW